MWNPSQDASHHQDITCSARILQTVISHCYWEGFRSPMDTHCWRYHVDPYCMVFLASMSPLARMHAHQHYSRYTKMTWLQLWILTVVNLMICQMCFVNLTYLPFSLHLYIYLSIVFVDLQIFFCPRREAVQLGSSIHLWNCNAEVDCDSPI